MSANVLYNRSFVLLLSVLFINACQSNTGNETASQSTQADSTSTAAAGRPFLSKPLVSDIFTADPSAHVFNGKIYIYPSHDIESGIASDDEGAHFDMKDYHIFSSDSPDGNITDHGVALDIKDIPWAKRQLWAPDAAYHDGQYYLYFPAKDKQDIFRIGVATSTSPTGPFKPQAAPIKGSFSIDPAVFKDADGKFYIYFGGIWGGQLQRWRTGKYNAGGKEPEASQPALSPKVARLSQNMLQFDEQPRDVQIIDSTGKPLLAGDNQRRFFEAAWVHTYNGQYYLSYSTGDTHFIAYATGNNPYGPFTYRGVLLKPVLGWTNHHSIVEFNGKWYLYYHDTELSGGKTHLRNIKVTELTHRSDGSIEPINPNVQQTM